MIQEAPSRPVFRYFGGKFLLREWITSHFPPHRVYVEPFAGSCSVLLGKPRSQAEYVSDLSDEVVNVFRVLRDPEQSRRLEDLLRLTPWAESEFRRAFEPAADPVEQARRTIFRSFAGHGANVLNDPRGTFRYGAVDGTAVCAREWAGYPDQVAIFRDRLQGVAILCRDGIEVIRQFDSEAALFYVDPPYPHATRGARHRYPREMTDDDHRHLAAALHACRGMVVLSGNQGVLYGELFGEWSCVTARTASHTGQRRTETLWLNPACRLALAESRPQPVLEYD